MNLKPFVPGTKLINKKYQIHHQPDKLTLTKRSDEALKMQNQPRIYKYQK